MARAMDPAGRHLPKMGISYLPELRMEIEAWGAFHTSAVIW